MVKVVLDAKVWKSILSSIGDRMEDVRIVASSDDYIEYDAALSTHYIHYKQKHDDAVKAAGNLTFSDMKKTNAFLSKSKGDVIVSELNNKLVMQNGSKKISIPVQSCKTAQLAPTMSRLVLECETGQWRKFGRNTELSTHGKVLFSDLIDGANIAKSLSVDSEFQIKANAEESEIVLHAYKRGGSALTCSADVQDAEGPNHTIVSSFGSWLLSALSVLDNKTLSTFHCGDAAPLIVVQSGEDWERKVVVIDQEA